MGTSKAIAASLLLAVLAIMPATCPAQGRASTDLQEAESLLEKQDYTAAEAKLQALTQKGASNPQAWFDLGFAESHLGKSGQGATAYAKAVQLSPKWFEANLNLGLALAKTGNTKEAANAFRAATQLKPSSGGEQALSNAWFSLAEVTEDSDPKEALAAYQKAAELNPKNAEALTGAGLLMEKSGDAPGAVEQYSKAAALGSEAAAGHLFDYYLKQGRLADAERWLRQYTETNQSPMAKVLLSRLLRAQGKLPEAIANLQPVANSNAATPETLRELAELYSENKQYEEANKLFQPLVDKYPVDAAFHSSYGSALLHQHRYQEAESELLKAVQLKPTLADAYGQLAYAAQQDKHYELAIRALDARTKYLPETAATYWVRAVSYDSLRAYKLAAENYKLFLAASNGKSPDQEFLARHRLKAIEPK